MTKWSHLFEADAKLRALEAKWKTTGDVRDKTTYIRALHRTVGLHRLTPGTQVERMSDLMALEPMLWKPIDNILQRKGWVEVWDGDDGDRPGGKAATPTSLAYKHFHTPSGAVNKLWVV
jgi:hypothetical protein